MAEYIDKAVALSMHEPPKSNRHYQTDNLDDAYGQGWDDALCSIEHIPAADVAPVVRCKDCTNLYGTLCISCGLLSRKPDDFCSLGERKETDSD